MTDIALCMDPGDKHVGVCVMDLERGTFPVQCELPPDAVADYMRNLKPKIVVLESFRVYGHKSTVQTGSSMRTPQLIGIVKQVAREEGIHLVEQQPSVRRTAEASPWARRIKADKEKPKNRHIWDATLHAIYYHRFNKKNPRVAALRGN